MNVLTKIEKLSHEGRGIAFIQGKSTFIFGALPQETITFVYTKRHTQFDEGEVQEIHSPAPERVKPKCEHFSLCGGCSLQHMDSAFQIHHKEKVWLEQLKRLGGIVPEAMLLPLTGSPWSYRRKARLGIHYLQKNKKCLVGFRERKSHFLADLNQCEVLDSRVGYSISSLKTLLDTLASKKNIPQIEVAGGESMALVFRHLEPFAFSDLEKLKAFGAQHGYWIYLQPGGKDTVYRIFPEGDPNALLAYVLPEFDIRLAFHPLDFIQINSAINHKLVSLAKQLLEPRASEKLLDLFCGLGNFTLPLARYFNKVIGVEGDTDMAKRAQLNAEQNAIENALFYAADLERESYTDAWAQATYDKILLDPPRVGAQKIIPLVITFQAKRIVYISCNPATLARDARSLIRGGYTLKQAGIIDMFPGTSHIESIAVFDR